MITALYPAFLLAGALLAAGAVALHLLSRRPPERRPLPTARFLDEDRRTLLRFQRRPSDLPILLVRVIFALLLGAAFADLSWSPTRSGVTRFVLVDMVGASLDGVEVMTRAVDEAVADAESDGIAVEVIAYGTTPDGALVVTSDPESVVQSLEGTRSSAMAGLRALSATALIDATTDSAEVLWILRPDWSQWTTGVGLMRPAFWPGSIEVRGEGVEVGARRVADVSVGIRAALIDATRLENMPGDGRDTVLVLGGPASGAAASGAAPRVSLERALEALGHAPTSDVAAPVRLIFAEAPRPADLPALLDRAREGSTLVMSGRAPEASKEDDLPWSSARTPAADERPRVVLRGSGEAVGAPVQLAPEGVRGGGRVLALFDDLRPAASARRLGEGCVVWFAASLHAPSLTASAAYPDLVRDLIEGCDDAASETSPLDAGAIESLTREDLPARVAMADVVEMRRARSAGPAPGIGFTPFLLVLAIAAIGAESWMTRRRDP